MRPRRAQERHTHGGLGSIGAGQRGLQIAAESGDGQSSWGRQSAGGLVTDAWADCGVSQPDGTSGLALDMLRLAAAGKISNAERDARCRLGSAAAGDLGPLAVDALDPNRPAIRWRWRFGPGSGWLASDQWWAALSEGDRSGMVWENALPLDADEAAAEYTVTAGGGLTETPNYVHFVDGVGTDASSGAARHFSVGGGAEGALVATFRTGAAQRRIADGIIRLGIDWLPGDLVTWDVTWPAGVDVVTMKVWRQRLASDEPVAVEFRVPWQWLPLECPPQEANPGFAWIPGGYYNSILGTWRDARVGWSALIAPGSMKVTLTPLTERLLIGDSGPPNYTPVYESGPYTAFGAAFVAEDRRYADSVSWSGSVGEGKVVEDATLPLDIIAARIDTPEAVTSFAPSPVTTHPFYWDNTDYTFPATHVGPQLLGDVAGAPAPTQRLYWAGFVDPRPTDVYGIGPNPASTGVA